MKKEEKIIVGHTNPALAVVTFSNEDLDPDRVATVHQVIAWIINPGNIATPITTTEVADYFVDRKWYILFLPHGVVWDFPEKGDTMELVDAIAFFKGLEPEKKKENYKH